MADKTENQKNAADREIKHRQREVKYDLRDFTVAFLVEQFRADVFYIPEYQRAFIWTNKHRCRFIESVLLGLPIPMMFVADMEDGRLEIVDGAQQRAEKGNARRPPPGIPYWGRVGASI